MGSTTPGVPLSSHHTTLASVSVSSEAPETTTFDQAEYLRNIQNRNIASIITKTIQILTYTGGAFELMVVVFFCYQFLRRSKDLYTAYYIMNTIGYVVDFSTIICNLLDTSFTYDKEHKIQTQVFVNIDSVVQWYATFFAGPWVSFMAANRLTAIVFWKKQEKIWRGKWFYVIGAVMLASPFIIDGYSFYNIECRLTFFLPSAQCAAYTDLWTRISAISNIVNAVMACAFGLTTAFSGRLGLADLTIMSKYEKRLGIQCIVTSFLFVVYAAVSAFYSVYFAAVYDGAYYYWWHVGITLTTNFIWLVFHYLSMIMLMIASPPFYDGFFKFYGFDFLLKRVRTYKIHVSSVATSSVISVNQRNSSWRGYVVEEVAPVSRLSSAMFAGYSDRTAPHFDPLG